MKNVLNFLKSGTGHKLVGVALGAGGSYLLTGHVDLGAILRGLGLQ